MTATPQTARPLHLDPRALVLVAAGGAVGTLLRAGLAGAFPVAATGWPWPTFAVNLTGAFLLGLLLGSLQRRGPDEGRRRRARLALGSGVLGGYTTYSTLAVESIGRLQVGHPASAFSYLLTTVALGVGAAAAGLDLAARVPPEPPT